MTKAPGLKAKSLIPEAQRAEREERIRQRAYELFVARNCENGNAEDDWFRAEAELAAKPAEATK